MNEHNGVLKNQNLQCLKVFQAIKGAITQRLDVVIVQGPIIGKFIWI